MGQVSRHRKNSVPRKAARIALVLGIVAFTGAAAQFGFSAYESSDCYDSTLTDQFSGEPIRRAPIDSDSCRLIISRSEEHQRVDAAIALLAILIVVGGAVRLSNASRRTRRIVLMTEFAVVAIGIVYTILLASVLR